MESQNPPPAVDAETARPASSRTRRWLIRLAALVAAWLLLAYVILPLLWRHHEHHPGLADAPKTTVTSNGIPGDALNVGLIGAEEEVVGGMLAANWKPADPITLKSSIKIASSVVMDRAYAEAPVSNLFVFGRKQDLAFEKPVGDSAKRRHHVRFWKTGILGKSGRPIWLGAATFDQSVGLSHRTAQITHHIAPDIDAERNLVIDDLIKVHRVKEIFQVTGVGPTMMGKNGGGDRYYTDGELSVGSLTEPGAEEPSPVQLANPPVVQFKDQLWSVLRPLLEKVNPPPVEEK